MPSHEKMNHFRVVPVMPTLIFSGRKLVTFKAIIFATVNGARLAYTVSCNRKVEGAISTKYGILVHSHTHPSRLQSWRWLQGFAFFFSLIFSNAKCWVRKLERIPSIWVPQSASAKANDDCRPMKTMRVYACCWKQLSKRAGLCKLRITAPQCF